MKVKNMYKKPLYDTRQITDLRDMIMGSVEMYADKTAFLTKPVKGKPYVPVTYKEYGDDLKAFGSKLLEMGLGKDKKVAILAETRYEWYVSYLAVVTGLAVIVPLDKELPPEEINLMLKRANCNSIIYSNTLREKVLEAAKGVESLESFILMDYYKNEVEPFTVRDTEPDLPKEYSFTYLVNEGQKLLDNNYRDYLDCDIDVDEMRILLFTSGTTSRSKAVMHSHHTISTNLISMVSMIHIGDDTVLSILPIHHTYECTCDFLCQVYKGNTIAECEGLRHIPANLKESETTLLLGVPLILETFHKRIWRNIDKQGKREQVEFALKLTRALRKIGIDLRKKMFKDIHAALGGHLRLIIAGGAAIDPQVLADFDDFGILALQGYGLTECGPILALNRDIHNSYRSAGLPLPGTEAEVVDPDENGIGEFRSRGENVMLGYYGDPELTAETLKDGWFYTGDYGFIDEEGFLIITGRKKNVIVTKNGENVFPEELEALINRNPEVAESIVSSAAGRNGDMEIAIEIYPDAEALKEHFGNDDYTDEEVLDLMQELVREFNSNQPLYKRIKNVSIRHEPFKKNTSQKIVRNYSK